MSMLSKAKEKVARWFGSGDSKSSDNTTTDSNAASPQSSAVGSATYPPPTQQQQLGGSPSSASPSPSNSSNFNNAQSPIAASTNVATSPTPQSQANHAIMAMQPSKIEQLDKLLNAPTVDVAALRDICWCGVPDSSRRFESWCLMLRYLPSQVAATGASVLLRKRAEYLMYVQQHHANVPWDDILQAQSKSGVTTNVNSVAATSSSASASPITNQQQQQQQQPNSIAGESSESEQQQQQQQHQTPQRIHVSNEDVAIMRQIRKDVPRTFGGVLMLQHPRAQLLLERVLFLWAIRHPASGYVQGMNDLLLPFLFVTMSKKISSDGDVHRLLSLSDSDVKAIAGALQEKDWSEVEADSFWLLSAFMSSVQSNFTFSQGGTHALVQRMERVVALADPALHAFLKESGVSFEEFAFRWMNCFLLREFPPALGVRLFDTYLAEDVDGSKGFGSFHVFVCAAMLMRWSETLRNATDFIQLIRLLQNPMTNTFTEQTIGEITASAFVLTQQYGARIQQELERKAGQ